MLSAVDKMLFQYISEKSSDIHPALKWLERETFLRTNNARMLSGPIVGQFLSMVTKMVNPVNILDIGTFTGYSALCFALAMREGCHIDSLERNDEMEYLILEGFELAGVSDRVSLHIGDAKEIIPSLNKVYDIVYIDANKREYPDYYDLVFDKVRIGGYIIADNVLWDGKVYGDIEHMDTQTQSIIRFNNIVRNDSRVENFIFPLRDGLNVIRRVV